MTDHGPTDKEVRVDEAVQESDDPRARRKWLVIAAIIIVLLALLVAGVVDLITTRTAARDAASGNATSLAQQVKEACADPAARVQLGAACQEAGKVVNDPTNPSQVPVARRATQATSAAQEHRAHRGRSVHPGTLAP